MIENFSITDFILSEEDMELIASMDTRHSLILDVKSPKETKRLYSIDVPV